MFGPVARFDLILSTRRGWQHLYRSIYAGWLAVGFCVLLLQMMARSYDQTGSFAQRGIGESCLAYIWFFVTQQSCLLWLAAPLFTAGAITEEKNTGTILYLLTTDLTSWEIVRDKVVGRFLQMVSILAVGFPFIAIVGMFSGLSGRFWIALFATVPQALGLTAVGILASVFFRKTSTAVVVAYGICALIASAAFYSGRFDLIDSAAALELSASSSALQWLVQFLAVWGGIAVVCLLVATSALRPVATARLHRAKRRITAINRPPVGRNPFRWKECYIGRPVFAALFGRLSPASVQIVVAILSTVAGGLTAIIAMSFRIDEIQNDSATAYLLHIWLTLDSATLPFLVASLIVLFICVFAVAARSAGLIAGEREQKTWELILVTPLDGKEILRGKLWGTIDSTRPILIPFLPPMLLSALIVGLWPALMTVLIWGMTWILMYLAGATGIYYSLRSRTTWRSMLRLTVSNTLTAIFWLNLVGVPIGGVLLFPLACAGLPLVLAAILAIVLALVIVAVLLIAQAEIRLTESEFYFARFERHEAWARRLTESESYFARYERREAWARRRM